MRPSASAVILSATHPANSSLFWSEGAGGPDTTGFAGDARARALKAAKPFLGVAARSGRSCWAAVVGNEGVEAEGSEGRVLRSM